MATTEECRQALEKLAAGMTSDGAGAAGSFDRSLSAHMTDLDVTFSGDLHDGTLTGITTEPRPRAQIRLTLSSDDLLALTAGTLAIGSAWASGRVKIEAGFGDLLRLRKMF